MQIDMIFDRLRRLEFIAAIFGRLRSLQVRLQRQNEARDPRGNAVLKGNVVLKCAAVIAHIS